MEPYSLDRAPTKRERLVAVAASLIATVALVFACLAYWWSATKNTTSEQTGFVVAAVATLLLLLCIRILFRSLFSPARPPSRPALYVASSLLIVLGLVFIYFGVNSPGYLPEHFMLLGGGLSTLGMGVFNIARAWASRRGA